MGVDMGVDMGEVKKVLIAGAGGIGRAVGLILREGACGRSGRGSTAPVDLILGDARPEVAEEAAGWIRAGSDRPGRVDAFRLSPDGIDQALREKARSADVLLDCLPGGQAPRMAELAREHGLHYANITEHVVATKKIRELAEGAETGFLLQTGLAPGVVDVLGHALFQRFCADFGVDRVEHLGMRTGALPLHAVAPHFYAFTWSPIGVATEYLETTHVLEQGVKRDRRALEEVRSLILDGVVYEEAYTSGGVADLAEALEGRVDTLEYKTLRHPGHWAWVKGLVAGLTEEGVATDGDRAARPRALLSRMQTEVPVEDAGVVVVYVFVQGRDARGTLRRRELVRRIGERRVGRHRLSAIQNTTASALAESARLLLTGRFRGVVLQSDLEPAEFLSGPFVAPVYDSAEVAEAQSPCYNACYDPLDRKSAR